MHMFYLYCFIYRSDTSLMDGGTLSEQKQKSTLGLSIQAHYKYRLTMGGSRGGQGVRTPLKNHKNIGFLNNICSDTLKITKLQSQHSMLGHHQPASEAPFKWCFAGGPMMAPL